MAAMKHGFLEQTPFQRARKIMTLAALFGGNAAKCKPPFAVMVYGSGSYGYLKTNHGKLNDLDIFLVVERTASPTCILRKAQEVFLSKLEISVRQLKQMLAGRFDICRMYGYTEGVRISFRLICADTFLTVSHDINLSIELKNIATLGYSRIVVDKEWSYRLQKYIRVVLRHCCFEENQEQILLVHQRAFSKKLRRLGAFGRKILSGTPLYDPAGLVARVMAKFWEKHVALSLRCDRSLSNDRIIDSLFRSERFSLAFRKALSKKIENIRAKIH